MSSEESSDEDILPRPGTPPELRAEAELAINDLLPPKSKARYMVAYDNFMSWKKAKNAQGFSENVFLAYFKELGQTKKSSTMWSSYSMIKTTMQLKHNVNIKNYMKLNAWLKRKSYGYKAKKSEIFTSENIHTFLSEAPDDIYLAAKVVLIIGIKGLCRAMELTNITTKNMEFQGDILIFKLSDTKNNTERSFVLRDKFLNIFMKYYALRPENTRTDRLFLSLRNGKCTRQVIGRHTITAMPKLIATYLNLANPHLYTGHCFRRTAATLADEDILVVKKHGGKNDKVAEEVDDLDSKQTVNILTNVNNTAMSQGPSLQQQRPSLYSKLLAGGSRDPPDFTEQQTPKFAIDMMPFLDNPGTSKVVYVKSTDPNSSTNTPIHPRSKRSQRCRFCFQINEECVPISPNYLAGDKTTIAFNNTQVRLDFADNFPNVVCKDCDIRLQIMYDFVKVVKAAQESLVNVELEIKPRRDDIGIEVVTVKTEYEDNEENGDSPDEHDNDENYDSHDEDNNDKNDDSSDENDSDSDNDTKEGILDSVTVGKTTFIKKNVTQKRKNELIAGEMKKAKTDEYEYTELVMDIKEEVIERVGRNDDNNTGIRDTGTTRIDVTPSGAKFAKIDLVHEMRSDGNS